MNSKVHRIGKFGSCSKCDEPAVIYLQGTPLCGEHWGNRLVEELEAMA